MKIITGMHRSGTSFVTNLLFRLGMDLGDHSRFLVTDRWNEAGYFENIDVMFLNDRMILGDKLYSKDYRMYPDGKKPLLSRIAMSLLKVRYLFLRTTDPIKSRSNKFENKMMAMDSTFDGILVKDPRFSITIEQWFDRVNIERIMYCFRHPYEVANSLKKRERIPIWLGLKIWEFHVKSFLNQTKGRRVWFVNFNSFFDEKLYIKEFERCMDFSEIPIPEEKAGFFLKEVLRKDLKHNNAEFHISRPGYKELYDRLKSYHDSGLSVIVNDMEFIKRSQ